MCVQSAAVVQGGLLGSLFPQVNLACKSDTSPYREGCVCLKVLHICLRGKPECVSQMQICILSDPESVLGQRENTILPGGALLPMGMSEGVDPEWGDATVLQSGQSSWHSGPHCNSPAEI